MTDAGQEGKKDGSDLTPKALGDLMEALRRQQEAGNGSESVAVNSSIIRSLAAAAIDHPRPDDCNQEQVDQT